MDNKIIVLTMYGTGKVINNFTITLFDEKRYNFNESTVRDYCSNINDIELKDDNWIYASIVNENQKIKFEKPNIHTDIDILGVLDDMAIQKILREIDSSDLSKALKTVKKETYKAILRNMTKRAAKMLIENIEYMGPIPLKEIREAQRKIVGIIQYMESTGEITIQRFSQDETV